MGVVAFDNFNKITIPLEEEDILCLNFREAWSKTLPVECYCGQYHTKTQFHVGTKPWNEDECWVAADIFKGLFPIPSTN